jgi:DnaJ-class molecular chaperone
MNPFLTLGVPHTADDATIRRRYLELIKLNPPDKEGSRFGQISESYAMIQTVSARTNWCLTNKEKPAEDFYGCVAQWARQTPLNPLPLADFKTFLRNQSQP